MNVTAVDSSKIKFFDYFFMFCMVIYAGSATVFARSLGNISTIGNAFGMIMTLVLFIKGNLRVTKNYIRIIVVFSCYAIITFINNKMINPLWYSQWIIWLTIASCICLYYKERLFICYETVLFHLSLVALLFWLLYLLSPEIVNTIVSVCEFSKPYTDEGNVLKNMIVYTLPNTEFYSNNYSSVIRNPGFAWEPGAYSCFICLAIFCNVLRTNFKIKSNLSLIVLVIALLSTQSTTGLAVFAVMLLVWLIINKRFWYAFLVLPFAIFLVSQEFVMDKFFDEYNALSDVEWQNKSAAIGRLASLQIEWKEFLRHPLIGVGGYEGGTWLAKHGYDVVTISGLGHMLSRFGAIMSLLFFLLLIKSSKCINRLFGTNNGCLLIVAIVGMMISYGLWKQPIYIVFWICCCFNNWNDKIVFDTINN